MGLACLPLPVLQCTFAGVVGIFQGSEFLLGSLDWCATIGVVHDHPDELLGLALGRGNHEAVDGNEWLDFGFTWHFRNMTKALPSRQTTMTLILL
jgi:hypothetical protein